LNLALKLAPELRPNTIKLTKIMSPKTPDFAWLCLVPFFFLQLCFLLFFVVKAQAVTLTSDQTDYTTTEDITTSGSGIISSLSGSDSSLNKITNTYTITTGNFGNTSSAYGIKVTGSYNQVTNDVDAAIITTGSSGRGISISDSSLAINSGTINTDGTSSYGIYAGGDADVITNYGTINTANSRAYGIYLNGDNGSVTNSGTINAEQSYGIYGNGNANQIFNSGTINTTSGSTSYGIYVSAASSSTASSDSYNIVDNSGIINSSSHGIYFKDSYTQISNSGTINSGSDSGSYGIKSEGDNSTITNSGDITSAKYAIYNSSEGTIINNSGNLTGSVLLGSATLNILGGTIDGIVYGSSGAGIVNIGAESDSASGAAISFDQLSDFTELDTLKINAGSTLNSYATIDAATILLDENSTLILNSGSSVDNVIQGVSDGVGILNINDISFSPSQTIGALGSSLAALNIGSAATLTTGNDIYATDLLISGNLNFYDADNLTIFGNVTGSGFGVFNIASESQKISGNFSLLSGDTFAVSLENNGAGNLTVEGAATIDNNSKLAITTASNQGYIVDGTQYSIISGNTDSAIQSIDSSNISVNDSNSNVYGLLRFTTQSTSDSLILNISRLSASEVTSNQNTQNIYQNLNEIGAGSSGKLLAFEEYLDNSGLTGDAITQTINQLAPQSTKTDLAVSSNITKNSIATIEARLNKINNTADSDMGNNLKHGIWIQSFGSSENQDAVESDDGYTANSIGFVLGADREFFDTILADKSLFGISLSYARSEVKSADSSKKNLIGAYQVNFYNGQTFGQYFLDTIASFTWNQYSADRAITAVDSTVSAHYNGQIYSAKVTAGRVKKFPHNLSLTPEISLNFLRNNIEGYSEDGGDTLNLDVSKVSADFLEGRIGLNLGWVTKFAEFPEFEKFLVNLKSSYGYSFINDAPVTTVNFSGQDSMFNAQISHLDRQSLKLGFIAEAYHIDSTTFSINYNFEYKPTFRSQFISLKIRHKF
jgi:outer membrane autotransporter protein